VAILLVAIAGFFLMAIVAILLTTIGGYSISGYSISGYCWVFFMAIVAILLTAIGGYYISGYYWLFY
jgi:hypothetical protein